MILASSRGAYVFRSQNARSWPYTARTRGAIALFGSGAPG
jgi:hypothetical protein